MDRHSRFIGELYYGQFKDQFKMNKNEIYVPINNRKEAKQAKAVLKALGIQPGNEFIKLRYLPEGGIYFNDLSGKWCNATSMTPGIRKEITLKQLIELLVSESNPMPTGWKVCDGGATQFKNCQQSTDILVDNNVRRTMAVHKIAVKVENEKEFKALMKYYDSLGYSDWDEDKPLSIEYPLYYNEDIVSFEDRFVFPSNGVCKAYIKNVGTKYDPNTYQIIPFADFAKEHNIKLPLITSEDGVDLYEGDEYHSIWIDGNKLWHYDDKYNNFKDSNPTIFLIEWDRYKAFSTKQAALSWIEAHKPKSIKVNLTGLTIPAEIGEHGITVNLNDGNKLWLSVIDINTVNKHMEELNNG